MFIQCAETNFPLDRKWNHLKMHLYAKFSVQIHFRSSSLIFIDNLHLLQHFYRIFSEIEIEWTSNHSYTQLMIFEGLWNFPRYSLCKTGGWKAREKSKPCKNRGLESCSNIFLSLEIKDFSFNFLKS